jgi:DNA-directed RNA polymerase subunit RPC12/RpoP
LENRLSQSSILSNNNFSIDDITSDLLTDNFVVPSLRLSARLHTQRERDEQAQSAKLPPHQPETNRCRFSKSHNGLGCASLSASHGPKFYESITAEYSCEHCGAIRLYGEAWDIKNHRPKPCKHCRGGKVHSEQMINIFEGYQKPFVDVRRK